MTVINKITALLSKYQSQKWKKENRSFNNSNRLINFFLVCTPKDLLTLFYTLTIELSITLQKNQPLVPAMWEFRSTQNRPFTKDLFGMSKRRLGRPRFKYKHIQRTIIQTGDRSRYKKSGRLL